VELFLLPLFGISLACNAFLYLKARHKPPVRQESYDARALLHDLTSGVAIIEVRRIAPTDVFLRSPRHG